MDDNSLRSRNCYFCVFFPLCRGRKYPIFFSWNLLTLPNCILFSFHVIINPFSVRYYPVDKSENIVAVFLVDHTITNLSHVRLLAMT